MKLVKATIASISLITLLLTNSYAGDARMGGFFVGSGTGAIAGQAIGQNRESIVVGATVGGIVGLLVGSELERHHSAVRYRPQAVPYSQKFTTHPPSRYSHRDSFNKRPVFRNNTGGKHYDYAPRYRNNNKTCYKTVTIRDGRHAPKRVVSTICEKDYRPYYRDSSPHGHGYRYYR